MKLDKLKRLRRRKLSIRNKIKGTAERPRISVFRSNKNISVQIINDDAGVTLVAASTLEKELGVKGKSNKASATKVGEALAKKALEKGIKQVVFDRNGNRYHGVVKELAEACRNGGLEF